jgi:lysophospholipase L1-like esterase
VTFTAPVVSGGVAPVQTTCTPASSSIFAVGTTTVRCTATDAAQATSSCSFSVTVAAPAPQLSRTKFLAFGDSMTAGEVSQPTGTLTAEGLPHFRFVLVPAASYPTQLLTQLRARYKSQTSQLQVTNAGWPGEWAEDGVKRLPGMLSSFRPEAVLLLEGSNDLAALGAPGVQRAARAIDTMAREVRNRGARLFIATIPPTRGTGQNAIAPALIQSLNSTIRTTARGENAVLVDVFGALSDDVTKYIGADGLHPTEAGYLKIAETFFAAIRADLER